MQDSNQLIRLPGQKLLYRFVDSYFYGNSINDDDILPPKKRLRLATNALTTVNANTNERPVARFAFSAIIPIIAGPTKKPTNPPLATAAIPVAALTPSTFAAALNKIGTVHEKPSPTNVKPSIAIAG